MSSNANYSNLGIRIQFHIVLEKQIDPLFSNCIGVNAASLRFHCSKQITRDEYADAFFGSE